MIDLSIFFWMLVMDTIYIDVFAFGQSKEKPKKNHKNIKDALQRWQSY